MDNFSNESNAILLRREQMLARLLRQIWYVMLAVILLGGSVSIWRTTYTGWIPLYSLHLALMIGFLVLFTVRDKLSLQVKSGITLAIFYIVGITGLFTFGVIGGGVWWLIMCTLLAHVFYTFRVALLHSTICFGIILAAAIGYSNGMLTLPFDINEYVVEPATWFLLVVGVGFLSIFIITALAEYQREILNLLQEVEKQRKLQEAAMDEIKILRGFIPICAQCKKIRDDQGYWENVEAYMLRHADVKFSHCLCPTCGPALYGQLWEPAVMDENYTPLPDSATDEQPPD